MEKGEFLNHIKNFEKSLFKAKNGFKEAKETVSSFEDALESLSIIESALRKNPSLKQDLFLKAMESGSVSSFRETGQKAMDIKTILENMADEVAQRENFLASFSKDRTYNFKDGAVAISFMEEVADVFSIKNFEFRPQFIGTIDIDSIGKELKLSKVKNSLLIPPAELGQTIGYLSENRLSSNLLFDSPKLKLFLHNPRVLRVSADGNRLKRIDRLCTVFGGKCEEKL